MAKLGIRVGLRNQYHYGVRVRIPLRAPNINSDDDLSHAWGGSFAGVAQGSAPVFFAGRRDNSIEEEEKSESEFKPGDRVRLMGDIFPSLIGKEALSSILFGPPSPGSRLDCEGGGMSENLLPCPFCGEPPQGSDESFIECTECYATAPHSRVWQLRTSPPWALALGHCPWFQMPSTPRRSSPR
jgi:hypothetical protein